MNDREIITGLIQGESSAFEYIWENYSTRIYNFICCNVKFDYDMADDILQDVFLHCLKKADQFNFKAKLSTWMFSIAYKKCCKSFRNARKTVSLTYDFEQDKNEEIELPSGENHDPEKKILWKQALNKYRKSLNALNKKQRIAWVLHKEQGLSHDEISEILNQSPNSCRILVSRAKKALLELIGVNSLNEIAY